MSVKTIFYRHLTFFVLGMFFSAATLGESNKALAGSNPTLEGSNPTLEGSDTAAKDLAERLNAINSLVADFQQTISSAEGETLQQASGSMAVKKPRMLNWKIASPYEHRVITNGQTIWLYDLDLEQITRQPFDNSIDQTPALLLSGNIEELQSSYTIEQSTSGNDEIRFSLIPKTAEGLFTRMVVVFQKERFAAMQIHDSFDQLTDIRFANLQLNPDIDDATFDFTPPEGVDIIDNES